MNTNEIECALCDFTGHVLTEHIAEEHPEISLKEYTAKHGPPLSPYALSRVRKHTPESPLAQREKGKAGIAETFGLAPYDAAHHALTRRFVGGTVAKYAEPVDSTPDVDTGYVFPEAALRVALMALALPERNRLWLHGYSGTGKSALVAQIAARLNYGLTRVNGDTAITRRQLIGDWTVKNGETVFQYGVLPLAMKRGDILLLDEVDHLNPVTLAVFRSVLEEPSTLVVLENGGEVIRAHPDFRVVATANTIGHGDDTGLFGTAKALSLADRQRFSLWAEVGYLEDYVEVSMVAKRSKLPRDVATLLVKVANSIRTSHKQGLFEESMSAREVLNWAEKYSLVGDAIASAEMCFLGRYQNAATRAAVAELIRTTWPTKKGS